MTLLDQLKQLRDSATPGRIFSCGYRRGVVSVKHRPEEDKDIADFDTNNLSPHEEIEANKELFVTLRNNLDEIIRLVEAAKNLTDNTDECEILFLFRSIWNATKPFTEEIS